MSDPFDDDDDAFFADPAALDKIAAIEERAIAQSQVQRKPSGYHFTIVKPGGRPRAAGNTAGHEPELGINPPKPINTNPRIEVGGFGWGPGGKHATTLASRGATHLPDDEPMDVVINREGHYGFQSADEDEIIDQRSRSEIRQLFESLPHQLPGSRTIATPTAAEARRQAITDRTLLTAGPSLARSKSSTSALSDVPVPVRLKSAPARTLSRSVSTGAQVFSRPAMVGTMRFPSNDLPPIASQNSQSSTSQGAIARRAAVELSEERRLREASEAEVRALRNRLAALDRSHDNPDLWHEEIGADTKKWEREVAALQQQLWTAEGKSSTARRVQEANESKLLSEIEKLKTKMRNMEDQMQIREHDAKQRIESIKTQAVFSNHNVIASASKVRQQSQRPASQRGSDVPTPKQLGSPLRDRTTTTPAPLTRSMKDKAGQVPPPRFDSLNNAFNITPTVASRTKRQRTDITSPTLSHRQRGQISPVQSPTRSQEQPVTPRSAKGNDMDIPWQSGSNTVNIDEPTASVRDLKAELVHHILNHSSMSPLQVILGMTSQPTVFRILYNRLPELEHNDVPSWGALCSDLLLICGDCYKSYDQLSLELLRVFAGMITRVCEDAIDAPNVTSMSILINLLRLLASTSLFFPSLVGSDPGSTDRIIDQLYHAAAALSSPKSNEVTLSLERDEAIIYKGKLDMGDVPLSSQLWDIELADSVIEVAESLCFADRKNLWNSDRLAAIILHLTQADNSKVVARGYDLFIAASYHKDNFRSVLFPVETVPGDVPVIDRVSRFLLHGHPNFSQEQFVRVSLRLLSALFMLSVADQDSVVLMTEHSVLVPALLSVLSRESAQVWGVRVATVSSCFPLAILTPVLVLLHHLVYPAPLNRKSLSQTHSLNTSSDPDRDPDEEIFMPVAPQGVDLARRLHDASSTKEFNGIQHVFVSTLGTMAYADVDVDDGAWVNATRPPGRKNTKRDVWWIADLRTIQFLSQDLLEAVVEGPEGDHVYEIFVSDDENRGDSSKTGEKEKGMMENLNDDEYEYEEEAEVQALDDHDFDHNWFFGRS